MQPAFEHAATHGGNGTIEDGGQGIFTAAGQVLGDFQVTASGRIHNDAVLLALHGEATDMRQRSTLGIFNILQ
ncbi:hypothetical protein D3C80_1808860 [compost metagenome]